MNSRNFTFIGVIALLVPLSIFLVIDIFSGGGNQLGNIFKWAMIAGAGIGFISPRAAVLLFLVFQFYADFLKRLMVLGDSMSMQDIMISLGLGPILIVAACTYCFIRCLTGKIPFFKLMDILFFLGCVGVSLIGAAQGWGGGINEVGQSFLGTAMIGMTAYAVYCLFREQKDPRLILKCIVIGAVPMALYTLWQAVFGIAAWEERYILTGLSKTLYQFYLMDGPKDIRPFSTLNTHTSVGASCGVLFLFSVVLLAASRKLFKNITPTAKIGYLATGIIYLAGCIASKNRTTYFVPVFYFLGVWAFSRGWRTATLYVLSIAGGVTFIANSQFIDDHILEWAIKFSDTSVGAEFGTLGTFQSRLTGTLALTEATYWTPFGIPENMMPATHDILSESIIRFGYVPLGVVILILAAGLFWWHRSCLRVTDPKQRLLLIRLTAISFSLMICGMAYGNLLFVAPVNGLLGAIAGIAMATLRNNRVLKTITTVVPANPLSGSEFNDAPSGLPGH